MKKEASKNVDEKEDDWATKRWCVKDLVAPWSSLRFPKLCKSIVIVRDDWLIRRTGFVNQIETKGPDT